MSFYTADSLTFSYAKGDRVFRNVSFNIEKNQHIGLIGPNGCGKTTLAKLLLGILKSQQGEIYLEGKNIRKMSLSNIGKEIGFVFQNPEKQLFCPTVSEQLRFSYNYAGESSGTDIEKRIEHYLEVFELAKYKDSSPMELSHGEKQRVALASALTRDVKFLILDEPATGLDILRKSQLAECLLSFKEEGRGYMIIGHEAKYLDRYIDKLFVLGPEGVEIS